MTSNHDRARKSLVGTDRLIRMPSKDAKVRLRFGRIIVQAAAVGLVAAAVSYLTMPHPRYNLGDVVETARVLFKFVISVPLPFGMIGLPDRLGRSAAPLGWWPWMLAALEPFLRPVSEPNSPCRLPLNGERASLPPWGYVVERRFL